MPPQKVPCHPAPAAHESESEEEEEVAAGVYPSDILGRYLCPHPGCGKVFKFKYDVPRHTKTHDKHEEGCEYTTSSYKLFMDHAKTCRGDAQYACTYCGEKFKFQAQRSCHEAKHCKK